MATLALAMIVKNECKTIERVLGCARPLCDEMIIVDTGSTDKTQQLARALGAKVHSFTWIDDFAAARNFSFQKCKSDWILWLDGDDVLTPENQAKLRALKSELNDSLDGVFCTYDYAFSKPEDGKPEECIFKTPRERLIRRAAGLAWQFPVHECIAVPAGRSLSRLDIAVEHRPLPEKQAAKGTRNLDILLKTVEENNDRRPRNLFYLANEMRDHQRWGEAVRFYEEYLPVSDVQWEKYAALLSLTRCYYGLKLPEAALRWATEAMLLDSQRAEAWMQLGLYHYDRHQWAQAIPYFHAASILKLPSTGLNDPKAYTWMSHDYISVCYSNLGQYHLAIEKTLDAIPNNPDKPRLIKNLHWIVDQL